MSNLLRKAGTVLGALSPLPTAWEPVWGRTRSRVTWRACAGGKWPRHGVWSTGWEERPGPYLLEAGRGFEVSLCPTQAHSVATDERRASACACVHAPSCCWGSGFSAHRVGGATSREPPRRPGLGARVQPLCLVVQSRLCQGAQRLPRGARQLGGHGDCRSQASFPPEVPTRGQSSLWWSLSGFRGFTYQTSLRCRVQRASALPGCSRWQRRGAPRARAWAVPGGWEEGRKESCCILLKASLS